MPLSLFRILYSQTAYSPFSFCKLLICSATFVIFLGLTPPSFPFQFRTAQVGVSMSKECNTCDFSGLISQKCLFLALSQHLSPALVPG